MLPRMVTNDLPHYTGSYYGTQDYVQSNRKILYPNVNFQLLLRPCIEDTERGRKDERLTAVLNPPPKKRKLEKRLSLTLLSLTKVIRNY
jgi:hypothetical protein